MPNPSYPTADALLHRALQHIEDWEQSWGAFDRHSSLGVDPDRLDDAFDEYLERLEENYPFHHPRYAGQMLKPPHPVALAAYAAAQRINPNNHALAYDEEAVAQIEEQNDVFAVSTNEL